MRLRTACDLEIMGDIVVQRPKDFTVPPLDELEKTLPDLIEKAAGGFAKPAVTDLVFEE